ncbi:hypothetical protein GCM10028810_30130 [Spirosoma litoris]
MVKFDEAQSRVGVISKAKASLLACDGICRPSHPARFGEPMGKTMDIEGKPFSKWSLTVATSAREFHTIPFSFPEPLRKTIS